MNKGNTNDTLQELLLDISHIWSWTFDYNFKLISTNCESPNLFTKIFLEDKNMDVLGASRPGDLPYIFSNDMGLMFSAIFGEKEIWFLGPVYTIDVNDRDIRKLLTPYHLSQQTTSDLLNNLRRVPLIASSGLFEKTLLVHRLITGELTDVSSIRYHRTRTLTKGKEKEQEQSRHAPAITEKRLLENVRTGNLNYQKDLSRAAIASPGIRAKIGDPLRQAKYSVVAFIPLCARAAIEGGLPSDTAYTLSDNYTTMLDSCKTVSEVTSLSHTMYEDYITRVHRSKQAEGLSRGVRIACEFIDMHPEEDVQLSMLAEKAGYAPYYLSRKFKQETGLTPASYLQKVRLNQAKLYLSTTRMSIQEISTRLHFCSRSYFTDVFSKENGISPAAWREEHLNI